MDEEGAEVRGTLGLRNRVVVNVLWLKVVVNEARVGCCSAGGFVEELVWEVPTLLEVKLEVAGVVDLDVNPLKRVLVVSAGFREFDGEAKVGMIEVARTRPTIGSGCGNFTEV